MKKYFQLILPFILSAQPALANISFSIGEKVLVEVWDDRNQIQLQNATIVEAAPAGVGSILVRFLNGLPEEVRPERVFPVWAYRIENAFNNNDMNEVNAVLEKLNDWSKWDNKNQDAFKELMKNVEIADLIRKKETELQGLKLLKAAIIEKEIEPGPVLPSELVSLVFDYLGGQDWNHDHWKGASALLASLSSEEIKKLAARQEIEFLRGEVIPVEEGEFKMGSPETEEGRYPDEPLHEVVTAHINLGRNPVTQEQYVRMMGFNPSASKNKKNCPESYKSIKVKSQGEEIEISYCEGYPVENLSKKQMDAYLNALTTRIQSLWKIAYPQDKRTPRYVLPTEEQWEKATQEKLIEPDERRMTSKHTVYSGTDHRTRLAEYAVYNKKQTERVGSRKPNSRGFYDMSGNVWEMTSSNWTTDTRTLNEERDDSFFVARGGSYLNDPRGIRSSIRYAFYPSDPFIDVGFRLGEIF